MVPWYVWVVGALLVCAIIVVVLMMANPNLIFWRGPAATIQSKAGARAMVTRDELEKMSKKQLYAKYNAMHERRREERRKLRSARQLAALRSIRFYTKGNLVEYILNAQQTDSF